MAAAASGSAAPRLCSIAISSNISALTAPTRPAARFHCTSETSRTRSGNRSSSHSGSMALAMRTSGDFCSRRSSASTATRNSALRHGARRRELRGAARRQLQFGALTAARHTIGKGGEDRAEQRVLVAPALPRRVDDAADLPHDLRRPRLPLRLHQDQQVGARGVVRAGGQALAGAEEGRHRAAVLRDALPPRFHDQARQPRMQRISRHFADQRRRRGELLQQRSRRDRARRRAARRAIRARGCRCARSSSSSGREVRAHDLGRVLRRTADEILERVETDGAAGAGAAGAARALVGGRLADAADLKRRQARPRRVARRCAPGRYRSPRRRPRW